jgi:hypothetical protein
MPSSRSATVSPSLRLVAVLAALLALPRCKGQTEDRRDRAAPALITSEAASPSAHPLPGVSVGVAPSAGNPISADAPLAAPDPLRAADGTPLPQLDVKPPSDGEAFIRRMELLVQAVLHDDPSRALPAFFPLVAYEQVKAIANPARDWQVRLVAAFERNIHEYHRALGSHVKSLRLVAIDVPESGIRWMKPGSEGNRVGYFRVLRSRLRVEDDQAKQRDFEITSLISWRGEWYVVHLNGFK